MKTMPMMETRTVALLIALAIGFGLAFHPGFFLVAMAVVLLVIAEWAMRKLKNS